MAILEFLATADANNLQIISVIFLDGKLSQRSCDFKKYILFYFYILLLVQTFYLGSNLKAKTDYFGGCSLTVRRRAGSVRPLSLASRADQVTRAPARVRTTYGQGCS